MKSTSTGEDGTPSNPLEGAVERAFPTAGAPEARLLIVVFASARAKAR